MRLEHPKITGIGSLSPFGAVSGPVVPRPLRPRPITGWPTAGVRNAYLIEPFRPTDIVPGFKTRRLDRLSIWSVVVAHLAIEDSGIDRAALDPARVAVVSATGMGCLELTEAYLESAHANGWFRTDPIVFPETLGNCPAAHVGRLFDFRGPNLTLGATRFAGEMALIQAASLIRHGAADVAIVVAGDTITRTSYEWYESAGKLSHACFEADPRDATLGFVPAEGIAALVLEGESVLARRRPARSYAVVRAGRSNVGDKCDTVLPADPVSSGLPETGALLRLCLILGRSGLTGRLLTFSGPGRRTAGLALELR